MPSLSAELLDLQRQFVGSLPARIRDLRAEYSAFDLAGWQVERAESLHRQLHSLIGSAATFGLHSLSVAAREVDDKLKVIINAGEPPEMLTWQSVDTGLARIEKLVCSRLDGEPIKPFTPSVGPRAHDAPLVYLVEDDAEQAEHFCQTISEQGYRVEVFNALNDFYAACTQKSLPDAVVLDIVFPEGDNAGVTTLEELKANLEPFPPVVFVSVRDDLDARLGALRAGASRYLLKPVAPVALIELLDDLTGRMPTEPYRVLLVDDDPLLLEAEASVLSAAGISVQGLSTPRDTLDELKTFNPDVVILDVSMPDVSGPELAAVIREQEDRQSLPILFLSAESDMGEQLRALNLGGDDFLVKPARADYLVSAVTARAKRSRQNSEIQSRLRKSLYEREREHLTLDYHALVSVADGKGDITEVNDRFCQVSGYSRAELIGQNHRIVKSDQHSSTFYGDIWRVISRGNVWQGEICNRRKDGSLYWVSTTITPFLDSSGWPYQYVSIRTDITDVKAREVAQARENAAREVIGDAAAHLLSAAPDELDDVIGSLLEQAGVHLGADRACLFLLSDGEESMSKSHEWCAPGIDAQKVKMQSLLRASVPWWWDQILREQPLLVQDVASLPPEAAADKKMFDSLNIRALCGFPIKRGAGRPLGFLGFERVDSTREWNEASTSLFALMAGFIGSALERARSERDADLARERLRRGQVYANIGTWEWNILTGELFWTERIAPLFGYPEGDLETSYDNFLAVIHPDDRTAVVDAVNACLEDNTPYYIEHRVVWPDGTVRWLLESGAVVRDANGNPLSMLGVVQDISDRKSAELALHDRQKALEEAQSLASLGNWYADIRTGHLSWSDEIFRIFGYEPGEIKPSTEAFFDAVHPEDRARVKNSERLAEKTGNYDVVHRIIRPDGQIRHVHELGRAGVGDNGELVRLSGTVQDITSRIEAESRLQETEQRFAFAVEGAGDGVWDWFLPDGRMILTGHYEPMLGFEAGELEPTIDAWIERVHPADLADVQKQLHEYLEGRRDEYSVELRLRCKNGDYKWVLCRGTVIDRDESGYPVRVIGIHSDIDERKASEQSLEVFKHVVNSVVDGVVVINTEGHIQLVSPAASQIFGYSPRYLKGKNVSILMPEPMQSEHDSYIQRYLHSAEARILDRQVEVTGLRRDGTEFPLELAISEISAGPTRYFVGLMRDITVRKRIESELVIAREEAERANHAKSDFLSSMSHELRTPMNAILGFAQLMEYDNDLQDDHQESVQEIVKAGEHLLSLINEVLDLAKVESGSIDLSIEAIDLLPVVEECLSLVRPMSEKRHIEIDIKVEHALTVRADRTRLKQVLLNLLTNSIKYNREDGRVSVEAVLQPENRVHLRVTDTGPGISKSMLRKLFEPFNRLGAETSEVEGTGIGLTITQSIMEMMGGSIGVNSEVGLGSCFWLDLPLENKVDSQDDNLIDSLEFQDEQAFLGGQATRKVLYVEDNPANLKLVSQILARIPHLDLVTAHTGDLGLELAKTHKPDLILLDINLPGMDGYQVMEALKADNDLQATPVVAVTANAMPRDLSRSETAGFTDYLTKPLNIKQFLATVNPLLWPKKGET
ncbi:MAG: PAS domain-containing protein [Marinobacter sp.]|nr:PAS domain-containing protein [Marinobacter sp.]